MKYKWIYIGLLIFLISSVTYAQDTTPTAPTPEVTAEPTLELDGLGLAYIPATVSARRDVGVYVERTPSSYLVGMAEKGAVIHIEARDLSGSWYMVWFPINDPPNGGGEGWIPSNVVTIDSEFATTFGNEVPIPFLIGWHTYQPAMVEMEIGRAGAKLRSNPSGDSELVATIGNTTATILLWTVSERDSQYWYFVRSGSQEGWIHIPEENVLTLNTDSQVPYREIIN